MANRFRELRESRGLNQTQVGELANVAQSAVSKWERGESEPPHGTLRILADFYGVSIDYLLGREPKTERAPDTAEAVSGALTEKEKEFLTYAGQMSEEQKGFLVAVMRALIGQGPAQSPDPPAKADETN